MARITLSGKLTEVVRNHRWGEQAQCMIQVSLRKELSDKAPVADRYYCCVFCVSEGDAIGFQPGQPIKITIEQN